MTTEDRRTATRIVYSTDNSIYELRPESVFTPTSADDVAQIIVKNAAQQPTPRPIVARGGGTGTNGQSLTDGITVDVKRNLNSIGDLNVGARTIAVEPGVVAARLDAHLRPAGLFWAPETSTVTRCTVGGMISTDAAGQGSLRHGRTSRHVLSVDLVLDDGTPWRAEAVAVAEAERRAAGDGREAAIWRALLDVDDRDWRLPELARGFSGYGIDRVRRDDPELGPVIDPVPVVCGSEGTLGVIVGATLKLTPIPADTVLVVAAYATFDDALRDSLRLRSSAPTTIETIDETTLGRGQASTAWPQVAPILAPDGTGSVLLIEYSSDPDADVEAAPDVSAVEALIAEGGRATRVTTVTDPAVRAAAWRVRADAVGILAKVPTGQPQPTAFVEDCAVPVAAMPEFIDGFRHILDGHGVSYGMFGHADVGCVHVRPALDLLDPAQEALIPQITRQVVDLLGTHGGILWGEHGRGVRGQFIDEVLEPDTVTQMRRIKTAFDPHDRFNPGKLYRPLDSREPLLTIDGVPTRAATNRTVPVAVRSEFATAFSCNGNGLCQHYAASEVMCPSYKATGDPAQSPKGRADLLRTWLAAEAADPSGQSHTELSEQIAENLEGCLSCAACTGRCPVQVDIPELKSRFFERFYQRRRRPAAHDVLSRFEPLASGMGTVASAFDAVPGINSVWRRAQDWGLGRAESALGLVDLPAPPTAVNVTAAAFDPANPSDLVVLPEVFTARFEPATLEAAIDVLQRLGLSVSVARLVPSGKFDHVKGNRRRFRRAAERQARLVRSVLATGAQPIVIDPPVALMYGHEYPAVLESFPTAAGGRRPVAGLVEVLAEHQERLEPVQSPQAVQLFGHCTERSLAPQWVTQWRDVLIRVGHDVTVVETTCCGMAGVFGHEAKNQPTSKRLFELGWSDPLAAAGRGAAGVPVATGWSCRSQAERFAIDGSTLPTHPIHLLRGGPLIGLADRTS